MAGARNMAQVASFREAVKAARCPVALAGAGLSAASGIPTFRGAGGLWRTHDSMSLATPQAFRADPSKVWQFYHYHIGQQVFPNAKQGFRCITQNVDGLSVRAAESIAHLQPRLPVEMHGSLFRVRCTVCDKETSNFDSPIAEALAGTEDLAAEYRPVPVEALPRCSEAGCGGLLRPGVVWFGESIPGLEAISHIIDRCDLLLVLGTSSVVHPAAGFAAQVQAQGGQAAVFNVEEADDSADWFFEGGVEDTLAWALGLQSGG